MRRIDVTDLLALDALHSASVYLKGHFKLTMTRNEAQANLDARAILFNCSNAILNEFGEGITAAEVEGAAILDSQLK